MKNIFTPHLNVLHEQIYFLKIPFLKVSKGINIVSTTELGYIITLANSSILRINLTIIRPVLSQSRTIPENVVLVSPDFSHV